MIKVALSKKVVKVIKVFICLSLLLAQGCAGKGTRSVGPIFFPPPPDDPRIQYLTGVSNSLDLAPQNKLSSIVTGGSVRVTSLAKPYGLTTHDKKIYIADIGASQIVVVDFVNKTMENLIDEQGSGRLQKPIDVAVDEDGYVYVADNGRKDIAVYSPKGKYLKSFGQGLENSAMVGVRLYKKFLLALDNRLGKIFIMDRKTGELLSTIGDNPDRSKNLALPNGIGVSPTGNIRVVNMGNGTVKEYDLDGNMLSVFGKLGDAPGQFTRPRGVDIDEEGQVFVVDAGHQVVQVFNEKNRLLGFFGQPGLPAGSLNLPAGIAITKDNLDYFQQFAAPGFKLKGIVLVTNQYSSPINHNLAVYGMGEMEGKKSGPPPEQKREGKGDDKQAPATK